MKTKHVVVEEYNETWVEAFMKIREYLYQVVPKKYHIEHVGSTSVKGLAAKPIIDIDVVYQEKDDLQELIACLSSLGYIHEGTLGIDDRDAFKYHKSPHMKHHLYAIKYNSKAYKDHINLKIYLKDHEIEKQQYGNLKMLLAKKYPYDIDAYYKGKSPYIEEILVKASRYVMEKNQ